MWSCSISELLHKASNDGLAHPVIHHWNINQQGNREFLLLVGNKIRYHLKLNWLYLFQIWPMLLTPIIYALRPFHPYYCLVTSHTHILISVTNAIKGTLQGSCLLWFEINELGCCFSVDMQNHLSALHYISILNIYSFRSPVYHYGHLNQLKSCEP